MIFYIYQWIIKYYLLYHFEYLIILILKILKFDLYFFLNKINNKSLKIYKEQFIILYYFNKKIYYKNYFRNKSEKFNIFYIR